MSFRLSERNPTPEEYNELRESVGWPTFDHKTISKALINNLRAFVAHDSAGNVVGMARVIGDGAIYFHVQDVIVRKDFQGLGIGELLMNAVMDFIDAHSTAGTNVGLMCSIGRENFYKKYGFISRPNEKFGAGMIQIK